MSINHINDRARASCHAHMVETGDSVGSFGGTAGWMTIR
jgi:hypothetical protein